MSNDNYTSTLDQRTKEWNDKTCEEISNTDKFPDCINHLGVQKNVIKRFLNFYLGGKIPKGLNVTDLVFAVLSIIPLHIKTEDTPWDKQEYGNGSLFSLLPEDIQLAKTDFNVPSIENNVTESNVSIQLNSEQIACTTENLETVEAGWQVNSTIKLHEPININNKSNPKNDLHVSPSDSNETKETTKKKESSPQVSNILSNATTENKIIKEKETNIETTSSKPINNDVVVGSRNKKRIYLEYRHPKVEPLEFNEDLLTKKSYILKIKRKILLQENEPKDQKIDNSINVKTSMAAINKTSKDDEDQTIEDLLHETNGSSEFYLESNNLENEEKIEIGTFEIPFDTKFLGFRTQNCLKIRNFNPQYCGHLQNGTFIKYCHSLLDEWDKTPQARIILKYFFGTVALILMRGVTKSYKHLVNTFSSEKFQDYITYINKFSNCSIFWYCIPQKSCIDHCYKTFRKRHEKTKIMLAKIVIYSIKIDKLLSYKNIKPDDPKFPESDDPFLLNIFRTTILAHTANYGLELISMVQSLADILHIESLNIAMEIVYCKETKESHKRLLNYLNQYLDPNANHSKRTHHWARVIDDDYFNFICCTNNYALAVILAVFTEKITLKKDIWKSKWVEKGPLEDLEKYKRLGERFFKVFLKKNPNVDHHIREFTGDHIEDKVPVRFLAPRVMQIRNGEKLRLAIRGYSTDDTSYKDIGSSNSSLKPAVTE